MDKLQESYSQEAKKKDNTCVQMSGSSSLIERLHSTINTLIMQYFLTADTIQ
jgi:hypothetical protein